MAYTAIDDPTLYFSATLYTGDGANDRAVTVAGTGMQPDMVWIKSRSEGEGHVLGDAVRGVNKKLVPNDTDAESSGSSYTNISTITSTGFTLSASGGGVDDAVNKDTATYVAWCWKESATAGFDIDSNSGTGSARTEAHSLSAVPHVIFMKSTNDTTNWAVYHHKNTSAPETDYLRLNDTRATADDAERWNDTAPTSSVFSVGTDSETNSSGNSYITYLWSEKQGFSKFGSYTGNGNADATFIYTGFKPAFIICKNTADTDHWVMFDNKRNTPPVNNILYPNLSGAEESTAAQSFEFFSNGFRPTSNWSGNNTSGSIYIYMCFAEAPFVNSNGVPCNAR